ncbi:hypothetical protein T459_02184 [Capsicum annuum]|uniref:GRF-type domain-containing protein n=1 Tax=Capsicum annuum TaxID=4072 RepID=A0A2G3AJ92_CAPAN|nr:hypothetical protein T459_02184 [Capsicum annuum]
MSHASKKSNARNKPHFLCYCGNPTILRKSCTDSNLGRLFYNCAVGQYNDGYFFFEWLKEDEPASRELREVLQELREFDENRGLLTSLLLEVEGRRDHLKGLLKETEQERDQLKEKLIFAQEKENTHKNLVYVMVFALFFGKFIKAMSDPVWNAAVLMNAVRDLQRTVHDLRWELAATRARLIREMRRIAANHPNPLSKDNENSNNNNN